MPFCVSFITHVRQRFVHLLQNLLEKLPSLHEPEVHYLKTNLVLCHSLLIIYEGISKSFEPNMERARNLDLFCFIFQRSPLPTPHTCPI